jgi:hypothetical protein
MGLRSTIWFAVTAIVAAAAHVPANQSETASDGSGYFTQRKLR